MHATQLINAAPGLVLISLFALSGCDQVDGSGESEGDSSVHLVFDEESGDEESGDEESGDEESGDEESGDEESDSRVEILADQADQADQAICDFTLSNRGWLLRFSGAGGNAHVWRATYDDSLKTEWTWIADDIRPAHFFANNWCLTAKTIYPSNGTNVFVDDCSPWANATKDEWNYHFYASGKFIVEYGDTGYCLNAYNPNAYNYYYKGTPNVNLWQCNVNDPDQQFEDDCA